MNLLYLDMDGVVADFNSYANAVVGREINRNGTDLTTEEWDKLTAIENFYLQLSPTPYGKRLVDVAKSYANYSVQFLTAVPRKATMPTAEADKWKWLSKYFPGVPMRIGPHSRDKWRWSCPGDILVDDKESNCLDWYRAGGKAIMHDGNIETTLSNLDKATKVGKIALILNL